MLNKLKSIFKPTETGLAKLKTGLPEIHGLSLPDIELLWFSDKQPNEISMGITFQMSLMGDDVGFEVKEGDDPSTIFIKLPVKRFNLKDTLEPLGYFPSYAGLDARQRWLYLNWLQDITQPIDIGYVFIYYYGLERHLVTGRFDEAFAQIIKLREFHRHPSFLGYSESALLNASLLQKRQDKIETLVDLGIKFRMDNVALLLAFKLGKQLSTTDLMAVFAQMPELNKRYFKEDPIQFETLLKRMLIEKYGEAEHPFSKKYSVSEMPRTGYALFANTSLPPEVRAPELPDFYRYPPFIEDIKSLFMMTHEEFKKTKKNFKAKRIE